MRRAFVVLVIVAGLAVGLLAEQQGYAWIDLGGWLPDLLTGWVLIGAGVVLLGVSRRSGSAALMLVAGFSWFAFNFATTGPSALGWLAARGAFVHRGALLALAATLPGTRARLGVAVACVAAVTWPLWDDGSTALVMATAFVVLSAAGFARARGRRAKMVAGRALVAVSVLAATIAAGAICSLAGVSQEVTDATVHAYEVAVAVAGVILLAAAGAAGQSAFVDRAVELERRGMSLRDVLRELLGDPELELVFADSPASTVRSELVETPLVHRGLQTGILRYRLGSLDDPQTHAAVIAAGGLAAERARLRAEVERQVDAIAASGRRLQLAEEDERRRLADTLDRRVGASLAQIDRRVGEARELGSPMLGVALDRAEAQVARARPELDAIVRGLGGVEPDALVPALERLAADLPIDVELSIDRTPLSAAAASAIWFVCAESLANTVKHAGARTARLELVLRAGTLRLRVEDDGCGGADPEGSGFAGLRDRVVALGGRLSVDSPPGGGTRVFVELPMPASAS